MKKKFYIFIFLCLVSSDFYAQQISYSKPIKLNNKTPRFRILGKNVNYIVAERWGTKFHYLDLYNANLKRVGTKELKLAKEEKIKKIWIQPKKGWILYTQSNKNYTLLKARQLDVKLNLNSKSLALDSILERKDLAETNIRFKYSLNEKYIATYLPIFSKGTIDYFKVKVFDTNLNEVQNIRLSNEYIKTGQYADLIVMNDGSVATIFKDRNESNNFKIYYTNSSKELKIYPLELKNQVFKRIKFEADNINQKLLIAGLNLYQETKRNIAADAFFTLSLDLETGIQTKRSIEVFTKDFFKLLTGKESKTEKVSLQTFYIKKIIPKVNDGYLVFVESFYENEESIDLPQTAIGSNNSSTLLGSSSFSSTNTYKTNYYFYNDVIIYDISNNQEILSANIIKKRQKSDGDNGGYSSFKIVNKQNLLEILFLDEISTSSSLKRYTFNKDAEIFKDYILNVSQNNVMPVVKLAVQTAPNEVLIPSYLNNSFSIIKVIFEDN